MLCCAISLLVMFAVWTLLVRFVDVRPIGPQNSSVGFSTLNGFVHDLTGSQMSFYILTDWLGLVPIATAFGFAVLGLAQWIQRKSLWRVDRGVLALGVFYLVVIAIYVFFEIAVVNYRPVLIEGSLEASYPSSTTVLVLCVMPAAAMRLKTLIKNGVFRRLVLLAIFGFAAFMVIGRLLSGVHWITDIMGGILLSVGLVMMYFALGQDK